MKRRAFLKALGVTALPLAGLSIGAPGNAHIQLYRGTEAVTDELPVKFQWDSQMKVTLQPSEAITVDRAVMRSAALGERSYSFDPIVVTPATTLEVAWEVRRSRTG